MHKFSLGGRKERKNGASKADLFLLHLFPVEAPQIAKQHFKQAPASFEKPPPRSGSEPTGKKKRKEKEVKEEKGGGGIVEINTSQSTRGMCALAFAAAYVDPAASFRGGFSAGAHRQSEFRRRGSSSHKIRNGGTG